MTGIALEKPIEDILKERLQVSRADIIDVCKRFDIAEFGLFGSVLRDDFRIGDENPSDVDVLIVFEPGRRVSWQGWQALQAALEGLFKRKVDLVRKSLLKNPYRRAEILKTSRLVFGAQTQ